MTATCADPECPRPRVRKRGDQWWCSWHPDQSAPSLDLLSGKVRDPKDPSKVKPQRAPRAARRDPDLGLQRELEQMERTDPAVAAAAASYDATVDSILARPPAAEPDPAYRAPGRVVPAANPTLCRKGCGKPAGHLGRCPKPRTAKPEPVEVATAYDTAADLVEQTPDPDVTTVLPLERHAPTSPDGCDACGRPAAEHASTASLQWVVVLLDDEDQATQARGPYDARSTSTRPTTRSSRSSRRRADPPIVS